jgi:hypothetical protein
MSSQEYETQKADVTERYLPWAEGGIGGSANRPFSVTVDWSGFDSLEADAGVEAVGKLMDQIRTVGPIVRGRLVAESHEQRQLVRTRVDGLRFEHSADPGREVVAGDGNTLVVRVLADREAATREDLWAAATVLESMPPSSETVEEESPFDYWKIHLSSLLLPEQQNKLSELSAKDLAVEVDWDSFGGYRDAGDPEEIMNQLQELVQRVQFTVRGMLFTGGHEERQLVRKRVDALRFGLAADEGQALLASDGNTLVFLLSPEGEPMAKHELFFQLPEVVQAMPESPHPVAEE